MVSALCSLQCSDTDDMGVRKNTRPVKKNKKPVPRILSGPLSDRMEEGEDLGGNRVTRVHPENGG